MRKMVSIQKISKLTPIENADRIEVARVLGWNVIVKKGEFKVDEPVLYFEVDSMLPESDDRFSDFQNHGQKTIVHDAKDVTGHVLRTMKMRGVISQGLIMPIAPFEFDILNWNAHENANMVVDGKVNWDNYIGMDVTPAIGVIKYEEPVPVGGNQVGKFDTRWMPKTDAERVQSLAEHWDEIVNMKWDATLKVDGTSTTILNDGENIRLFSRNWEMNTKDNGIMQLAEQYNIISELQKNPGMAVQMEYVGPGIQKNRLKLTRNRFFVFAVFRDGEKVPRAQWPQVFIDNGAPVLSDEWLPQGNIDDMIEKVSTLRNNVTKDVADEGVVYHLSAGQKVPEWMDRNGNFKIINNKYLTKHGI